MKDQLHAGKPILACVMRLDIYLAWHLFAVDCNCIMEKSAELSLCVPLLALETSIDWSRVALLGKVLSLQTWLTMVLLTSRQPCHCSHSTKTNMALACKAMKCRLQAKQKLSKHIVKMGLVTGCQMAPSRTDGC